MTNNINKILLTGILSLLVFTGSAQAAVVPMLTVTAAPNIVFEGVPADITFIVTSFMTGIRIDNASVNLIKGGVDIANGTTNANGTVVINVNVTSVNVGEAISVIASKTGYFSGSTFLIAIQRPLIMNATPKYINSGVSSDITVNVTAINMTGSTITYEPVPYASVNMSGAGVIDANGTTNTTGQVVINVNPSYSGIINITATKTGFINGTGQILVNPLFINATPAAIQVNIPTNITFNVTNLIGAPVDNASVNLSGAGVVDANGITDVNGTVVIYHVNASSAGTITATANKTGYLNGSVNIQAFVPQLVIISIPSLVKVSQPTNVTFLVGTSNTTSGSLAPGPSIGPSLPLPVVPTTGSLTPVPYASVNLSGAGVNANGTTDANGTVTLNVHALNQQNIIAVANKTNYLHGLTIINVLMDRLSVTANPMMVKVSVPTNVTFKVRNNLLPVPNASVNLTKGGMDIANGITDANGNVVIQVHALSQGLININANNPYFKNGTGIMIAIAPLPSISPIMSVTISPMFVRISTPTNVTFTVTNMMTRGPIDGANITLSGAGVNTNGTTNGMGQAVINVHATSRGFVNVLVNKTGLQNSSRIISAS